MMENEKIAVQMKSKGAQLWSLRLPCFLYAKVEKRRIPAERADFCLLHGFLLHVRIPPLYANIISY